MEEEKIEKGGSIAILFAWSWIVLAFLFLYFNIYNQWISDVRISLFLLALGAPSAFAAERVMSKKYAQSWVIIIVSFLLAVCGPISVLFARLLAAFK